jgi:hypothetical protein
MIALLLEMQWIYRKGWVMGGEQREIKWRPPDRLPYLTISINSWISAFLMREARRLKTESAAKETNQVHAEANNSNDGFNQRWLDYWISNDMASAHGMESDVDQLDTC